MHNNFSRNIALQNEAKLSKSSSRGHRLALFDPRFKVGGVGVSTHRVFGHVVVINMATAMLVDDDFCDKNNESCKILEIMCAGREESNAMKSDILATLKDRAERLRRRVIEGHPVISQPTLAAASTQWKDIGICHRCRQEILGGRVERNSIQNALSAHFARSS
eukprot:gene30016-39855_t